MKWHYLNTGKSSGKFNMDLDKLLSQNIQRDEVFFRLYRWTPYCISLGANQKIETIDVNKASLDNIDIVYRPTGGRGILHSEELTYSVVFPVESVSSARTLYHDINIALSEGLKIYNILLQKVELETEQPKFNDFYKTKQGDICFAVPAKSELKFNGRKLVGSAQRKLDKSILQHGSILCGKYHRNILSYLHLTEEEKSQITIKMESKTTELETILNEEINYDKLSQAILTGFENYFKTEFERYEIEQLTFYGEEILNK